ncbi:proline-rich protein 35 [Hoplias malabaricus]|uniref:proline-rich protein 35 n=1 Tax=Hoplias malabaricus TaxID=27720 RepID=UPI003463573F
MPKEECKVALGCKQNKERKPKKPHYIPRPFGKPYNYKCFQCPFTCMEKSHLYNHMKYSLCKNSLSLLIESDWPYKKGNLLQSDHLRLQQGALNARGSPHKEPPAGDEVSNPSQHLDFNDTDDAETEREAEGGAAQSQASETNINETAHESPKQEAELVMADVFSLEEQLLRARSVEVEAKLRHYRLSKTCLSGPAALLSEQFRLLSSQAPTAKPKTDPLPCYPRPLTPGHLDCPEAPGLNLSLLGVGYPLAPVTPGLFSYLNPALSAAAVTTATGPAQISTLPFLASAAQLTHTHTHTHSDRTLLSPPRLYYPFLCDHTLGDQAKAAKSSLSVDSGSSSYTNKLNMWKAPALRPSNTHTSNTLWTSPQSRDVKDPGAKRPAPNTEPHSGPPEKKTLLSFPLERATPTNIAADRLLLHSGLHSQAGLDERFSVSPSSRGSSPYHSSERARDQGEEKERGMERGMEGCAAALLRDLSSALLQYQQAEREAALQPEQHHLWAHLGKIRSELSHIQQALQRTARQSEGPLDLSVKKQAVAMTMSMVPENIDTKEEAWCSETEEEDEERDEGEMEEDGNTIKERRKRSLDVLIKLNQSAVSMVKSPSVTMVKPPSVAMVKSEVLPGVGGGLEALWHSRTTKCEADSSVLLCSKPPNRPPSIQHLDTNCPANCPPSPLTVTDA